MHNMHAYLPINSIKYNQFHLNYSSQSSHSNDSTSNGGHDGELIENQRHLVPDQRRWKRDQFSSQHTVDRENPNSDYKLNKHRQYRAAKRRKGAADARPHAKQKQSNEFALKKFQGFKNTSNDYSFMTANDLSPHQVFTKLASSAREARGELSTAADTLGRPVEKKSKSNYIDDDRSSRIDAEADRERRTNKSKKRTKSRNTGSLTNLFYQYTALMQSQLLPAALFMYNSTQLLPISLSQDNSRLSTSLPKNDLSTHHSSTIHRSASTNSFDDLETSSIVRRPEVAFLILSSNRSTIYEPSLDTSYSRSLNDVLSPLQPNEWLNLSSAYHEQNTSLNSTIIPTNTSDYFTLVPFFESLLNLNVLLTILISVIMVIAILVTAIGNLFVIAAILRDRVLRSVQNYLVLSLAIADLMVSLLVMPFAAVYEIQVHWTLGVLLCDIWTWADVLCCTASILHLLAIAVDRYWAVTSVEYMRSRSSAKILSLIAMVWFVALLISVGPLLGWKDSNFEKRLNEEGVCSYSQDLSYQLFATISTFYAPLIFILLLYWRIFQVARKRLRNKPGNQLLKSGRNAQSASTKTTMQLDTQQNSSSLPNEDSTSSCSRSNSKYCKSITNANDDQIEPIESADIARKQTDHRPHDCTYQDTNNNNPLMQSTTDLSSSVNSPATTIIELHSSTNTPMHLLHSTTTNGGIHQQASQTELLPMKQLASGGKAFSVVVADNEAKTTTTLILADESSAQFNVDEQLVVTCNGDQLDGDKDSFKKNKSSSKQANQSNLSKEMAARLKQKQQQDSKRERKTARILAIITGVFVICWLPFFVLTLLKALIPKYRDYTLLFSIFLWLGYLNSSLSPAIYTIFSPDFRSAFKKLIKGRRQS